MDQLTERMSRPGHPELVALIEKDGDRMKSGSIRRLTLSCDKPTKASVAHFESFSFAPRLTRLITSIYAPTSCETVLWSLYD